MYNFQRSFVCIGALFLLASCHRDPLAKYGPIERPYVERAIAIYSGHGKISSEQVLRMVDPVVVYLPNMTCVGMNLRRNWAGGDRTICFGGDGHLLIDYRNGE